MYRQQCLEWILIFKKVNSEVYRTKQKQELQNLPPRIHVSYSRPTVANRIIDFHRPNAQGAVETTDCVHLTVDNSDATTTSSWRHFSHRTPLLLLEVVAFNGANGFWSLSANNDQDLWKNKFACVKCDWIIEEIISKHIAPDVIWLQAIDCQAR